MCNFQAVVYIRKVNSNASLAPVNVNPGDSVNVEAEDGVSEPADEASDCGDADSGVEEAETINGDGKGIAIELS